MLKKNILLQGFKQLKGLKQLKIYVPTFAFIFGFTWDSFTLQIDSVFDNYLLMTYVIVLGLLLLIYQAQKEYPFREWTPTIQQFLIGGLFSAYVIYYLKSASTMTSWLFVAVLALLMFLNERMDWHLNRPLQLSLYFFIMWSFLLFFIPVNFKIIGHSVFFVSSIIALAVSLAGLGFLHKQKVFNNRGELPVSVGVILGLVGILYISYFKNWIPPVPISVKESGMYSKITRENDRFNAIHSKAKWYSTRRNDQGHFYLDELDGVYCIASIFAPEGLTFTVEHKWQYFDENEEEWMQSDAVKMTVSGGRDNGFRGYSVKRNLRSGMWRVIVATKEGAVLKRIPFEVKPGKNKRPREVITNEYS